MVAIAEKMEFRNKVVNLPPSVIRGWNSQIQGYVGVHWLRGSIDKIKYNNILEYFDVFFGVHESRAYGLWFYDRSVFWPGAGVSLHFQSTKERDEMTNQKITFELPGSALDRLNFKDLELFLDGLNIFEPTITRMDIYYDDDIRVITPSQLYKTIYEEASDGSVIRREFTPFRKITQKKIGGVDGCEYDEVAFGSRGEQGSGSYLRVYDKNLESNGENNSIRWELELSGIKAQMAYRQVINLKGDCETFAVVLSSLIGGCIDFVKRTGDKNIDRLERYEFWDYLLKLLGYAKIRVEKKSKSIPRAMEWVEGQVSGSLTAIHKAVGGQAFFEWLLNLVTLDEKLSEKHYAAIAEYQKDLDRKSKSADFYLVDDVKNYFNEKGLSFVF